MTPKVITPPPPDLVYFQISTQAMEFSENVDQPQGLEQPTDTQGNYSTLESSPAPSVPSSPVGEEEPQECLLSDPLGSPLPPMETAPWFFDGPAPMDTNDSVDTEIVVPSLDMAELLLSPESSLPLDHSQLGPTPPVPSDEPLGLQPKTEQPGGEEVACVPRLASPPSAGAHGAVAPSSDTVASAASADETIESSKFSYASVVARQRASEAAETAAAQPAAPLPSAPAGRSSRKRPGNRLTITTHHRLPDFTPDDHWHHLVDSHPWAGYVSLHETPFPSDARVLASYVPLDVYTHIPPSGYMSPNYVKRLFPHTFREVPSRSRRLPIIELMRLEHAVAFRQASQTVIDQLLANQFVAAENTLPVTPEGTMPSTILPERRPHFPVLYQVVNKGAGQGVVLEAKDFFVPGPDRRELHLIHLDQYATNVASNTKGFDRSLLSVKDFVWVYSVEPTRAALRDPATTLEQARIPKATALDTRFPYFFRVRDFVFVTPPPTTERTLGIVLSLLVRYDAVKGLKIAFESAPEAVAVSPSVCDFPLSEVEHDEIVSSHSRRNVSCSMRFSEFPASKEAQTQLCFLVRNFLAAHPEEGMLPLKVFKLSRSEKEWIGDRAAAFENYARNPRGSQRRMAQLFNVACSALAAVNCMNDDKQTHMLTATIPSIAAFPLRFDFTISDMSSECGWTNQRPVYLWIVGSRSLIRATIQHAVHSYQDRSMNIRLVVPGWAHRFAVRTAERFATISGDVTSIQVCVRLGAPPVGSEPLYALVSQRQLFGRFGTDSAATDVLDSVYGLRRTPFGPVGPPLDSVTVRLHGRSFDLRPDQISALQMSELRLPVLAIQAAYGTGKTVVGALIAARTFDSLKERVIATTTTNNAVAQFTDTLLGLDDFKHLDVLRFVSDSALVEGAPQTPIDLHNVLKRLPEEFGHLLSQSAMDTCVRYKKGRELLERFLFNDDLAVELSDAERDEYRIAERDLSDLTRDAVAVMFQVRPPAVVCITTSALLNSVTTGGIFCGFLDEFTLLIGDEASQIPEPALVAMATHLPQVRHIYIGDSHQLEPHARCPRTSNPAKFGAQGVMDILLAKNVPMAPLTTTFRAHPLLNELPNLMFYGQTLVNGTDAEDRQLFLSSVRCPNPELPLLFVDVPGTSAKSLSGSHSNEAEAEVCRQIVLALLRKNIQPSSIAVIVFYKEQARLLAQFSQTTSVDLHTVDSVQGREKDIILLLTTRTGFDPTRGEFLNDPHRLNVALSRCRHGLFILGHEQSLTGLSYWNTILQWANHRQAITSATSLPDLLE